MKKLIMFLVVAVVAKAGETQTMNQLEGLVGSTTVPRLSTLQLLNAGDKDNEALKQLLLNKAANPAEHAGKKIAVLATDGVEEIELAATINYFKDRGARVELISTRMPVIPTKFGVQFPAFRKTHILTVRFMENASLFKIDRFLDQVKATEFDAVIIPGGAWNPDILRSTPAALEFVRMANQSGKTLAAICHGPLVFVTAGILNGRSATAYGAVQIDLKNSGAKVSDEPVLVDGNIITSRMPNDLPQFLGAISKSLQ